jgi:hypothetical protein
MLAVLKLIFKGKEKPRQEFIQEFLRVVSEFVDEPMNSPLPRLLYEIAKNIYDHADCSGKLSLIWRDLDHCEFEMSDNGTMPHDLEFCRQNSRLAGKTDVNCRLGLGIIQDISSMENFENFHVDTTRGFKYSGVYLPPIAGANLKTS